MWQKTGLLHVCVCKGGSDGGGGVMMQPRYVCVSLLWRGDALLLKIDRPLFSR